MMQPRFETLSIQSRYGMQTLCIYTEEEEDADTEARRKNQKKKKTQEGEARRRRETKTFSLHKPLSSTFPARARPCSMAGPQHQTSTEEAVCGVLR
jgi:hypothetical protein